MLFALYDFLAYCLYSISRFSGGSALLCAAFSEKPAVFRYEENQISVMKRRKRHAKNVYSGYQCLIQAPYALNPLRTTTLFYLLPSWRNWMD